MARNAVPAKHEQQAVGQRAHDPPAVLVEDAAHAQLAASGQGEDAVDPLGQAAEVGEHRQQLVAHQLPAVDDGSVLLAVDELHRRSDERQVGDQGAQCAVDRDERPREQHDVGG